MTVTSHNATHLILVCEECDEKKILWTEVSGRDQLGHSWIAANRIADDFDKLHEGCEEESN